MKRRHALQVMGGVLAGLACMEHKAFAEEKHMDVFTALRTRRSIRAYTQENIAESDVTKMLEAAMFAPSAGNEQPWEFILIRDKTTLCAIGEINSFAGYAHKAPLAILTCLNTEKEKFTGFGVLDIAAATQNLLLAAHGSGLGAVWTGVYPVEERIQKFQQLVHLPKSVIPIALVVIGHRSSDVLKESQRFDASRIHAERWQG